MSVFNLDDQNNNIDNKIISGLEKLSQVFRILLWDKAKDQGLSPIQIQLLIFIQYHSEEKTTISYLAQEFSLTKPTISEAVKVLEKKQMIQKTIDTIDTRSYTIKLTSIGKKVVAETESYIEPFAQLLGKIKKSDKLLLWQNIVDLINQLNKMEIISIQRSCYNCQHYTKIKNIHHCSLLNQKLEVKDIRIDCAEFLLVN